MKENQGAASRIPMLRGTQATPSGKRKRTSSGVLTDISTKNENKRSKASIEDNRLVAQPAFLDEMGERLVAHRQLIETKLKLPRNARVDPKQRQYVSDLRESGTKVIDSCTALIGSYGELANEASRTAATLVAVQAELADEKMERAKEAAGLIGQRDSFKSKCSQLSSEMDKIKTELLSTQLQLKAASQKVQDTQEAYEREAKVLKSQIKTKETLAEDYRSHYTAVQNHHDSLQKSLFESSQKLDRLQGELLASRQEAQELATKVETQLEQMQMAKDQAGKLTAEIEAKQIELYKAKAENGELRRKCTEAEEQLEAVRGTLRKTEQQLAKLQEITASKNALDSYCSNQAEVVDGMRQQVSLLTQQRDVAQQLSEQRAADIAAKTGEIDALQAELIAARDKIAEGEVIRRRLHNTIQELKGNIRVFARVRPALSHESKAHHPSGAPVMSYPPSLDPNQSSVAVAVGDNMNGAGLGSATPKHVFMFDKVFEEESSQEAVFEEISQLVQSALDGYKVCIFAYGQTGSGKTHTMMGTPGMEGMIPRAMKQIFDTAAVLRGQGWQWTMTASMVEIYNEELKDLLGKGPSGGKKHTIQHDGHGNTTVSDVVTYDVSTPERISQLLAQAMKQRAVASTQVNERSSRSHMVFTLTIQGANPSTGQKICGALHLVDLAGSERVKESGVVGDRLKETRHINKSLSALGDVIQALSSKSDHVPYRNSKLTYLLQTALGGNSKTLMFVNVSPLLEHANESLCSLRFAAKVNSCEIGTAKKMAVK